jgi:hypothetical protein
MRVDNGLTRVLDPAHVTDYLEFAAGLAAPAAPGAAAGPQTFLGGVVRRRPPPAAPESQLE